MLTSLPNLLTLARVAIIPVIVALIYLPAAWAPWAALAIYAGAAVTDWLDGYLARQRQEVSPLGRFLDPVADKLLVTAVVAVANKLARIVWAVLPSGRAYAAARA